MRFAVPIADGRLCMHFGHCQQFALVDVAETKTRALTTTYVTPPPHEPGLLPRWLHEQGVNIVIAGGLGQAQQLFAQSGITVVVGAPSLAGGPGGGVPGRQSANQREYLRPLT